MSLRMMIIIHWICMSLRTVGALLHSKTFPSSDETRWIPC